MDRSWFRLGKFLVDLLIVAGALLLLLEGGFGAFGAPWTPRLLLLCLSAALDLFFTLEFALRLGSSFYAGELRDYISRRGGWLEGLSSLPLLALVSGPLLFSAFSAGGKAEALAIDGASRLQFFGQGLGALGLLRLLRLLRLRCLEDYGAGGDFRRRALLSAFLALFGLGLALGLARLAGAGQEPRGALAEKRLATFARLEAAPGADGAEAASGYDSELLLVRTGGRLVYTRYSTSLYPRLCGPEDIGLYRRGETEAFFSLQAERRAAALASLAASLAVLAVFAALILGSRERENPWSSR